MIMVFESNHCLLATRSTLLLSFVTVAPPPVIHLSKHSNALNLTWMNKETKLYLILSKFNPINTTINQIRWRDGYGTYRAGGNEQYILLQKWQLSQGNGTVFNSLTMGKLIFTQFLVYSSPSNPSSPAAMGSIGSLMNSTNSEGSHDNSASHSMLARQYGWLNQESFFISSINHRRGSLSENFHIVANCLWLLHVGRSSLMGKTRYQTQ